MDKHSHEGHRERMRKRYLNEGGFDNFEEHQILEMLLFYALPRRDTNELAHRILKEFGSLEILINSQPEAIAHRTGVSINTAVLISMMGKIGSYSREKRLRGVKLDTTEKVKNYCIKLLESEDTEVLYVLCLDKKMRLIVPVEVARGGKSQVAVRLSAMLAQLGTLGAEYAICTHNHPTGVKQFSMDDISSTIRLRKGLSDFDVTLMDHILVCGKEAISMSETKKFKF